MSIDHPVDTLSMERAAVRIRRRILDAAYRAGVGHIGSALSVADVIAVLYSGVLRIDAPDSPERDRFVLSKGHAAMALYAGLVEAAILSDTDLHTYCSDGSAIATHPERVVSGVDFCSGSLGQGLSVAVGSALAASLNHATRRTYVLLSDAECDCGATWEAALFAAHHGLASLTAIIDVNGQQAFGRTSEVLELEPLAAKWTSFGWDAVEVNGHDVSDLHRHMTREPRTQPRVLIARTLAGRGVSFMESQIKWHYWPMSEEQYLEATAEVEAGLS